jgi:hypothetical protein
MLPLRQLQPLEVIWLTFLSAHMGSPAVGSAGLQHRTAAETVTTMSSFFQRGFVAEAGCPCYVLV